MSKRKPHKKDRDWTQVVVRKSTLAGIRYLAKKHIRNNPETIQWLVEQEMEKLGINPASLPVESCVAQ